MIHFVVHEEGDGVGVVVVEGVKSGQPLTGWIMSSAKNFPVSWFRLFQLPDLVAPNEALFQQMRSLHHSLFALLVVVAALHVAGALKHHFIDRNDVLRRMLPFGGVE